MKRFWRPMWVTLLTSTLVLHAVMTGASTAQEPPPPNGFRALSGAEAASFPLPADVRLVRAIQLSAYGLTLERYQQYVGAAEVLDGQLTLYRNAAGTVVNVIGAHYPSIAPANRVALAPTDAAERAQRDVGPADSRVVDLMIDPASRRFFFRVESRSFASRWFHWIDAQSGGVINRFDAIQTNDGVGVKGDTKSMAGLTHASGSSYLLESSDLRQKTFDAKNCTGMICIIYDVTDSDDHWTTSGRTSPGHPALVDAQFYANVADDYYQTRHGFNWLACTALPAMKSVAHYGSNYNNAFWNGTYVVFGDGDGTTTFRELSGGLDVAAHEYTHAVTDCTSGLVYQNESGALNESFSDIIGNSAEYFFNELTASNCVLASGQTECADFWIGEDVFLGTTTVPGFRNMKEPQEDGDPDRYSERYTGTGDNGGVHTNSGIPNHAFVLLALGGKNAGCEGSIHRTLTAAQHAYHTQDCHDVPAIGLLNAERIFWLGFAGLTSTANMTNARNATVAVTNSSNGFTAADQNGVACAWQAVGVSGDGTCTPTGAATATPTPSPADPTPTPTPPGSEATPTPTSTPTATPNPTSTPVPSGGTAHVGDLDGSKTGRNSWKASVTIRVEDSNHVALPSATLSGSWSGGYTGSASCTTGSNGRCKVTTGSIPSSSTSVTFTVTNFSHASYAYNSVANHDPDGDSNGTTITVTKL